MEDEQDTVEKHQGAANNQNRQETNKGRSVNRTTHTRIALQNKTGYNKLET